MWIFVVPWHLGMLAHSGDWSRVLCCGVRQLTHGIMGLAMPWHLGVRSQVIAPVFCVSGHGARHPSPGNVGLAMPWHLDTDVRSQVIVWSPYFAHGSGPSPAALP